MRNAECGMRNAECGIVHRGDRTHFSAPLTQGSREVLRECSLRHLHRGAEAASPQSYRFAAPFPKKKVYKILFYYIMQYDIIQ